MMRPKEIKEARFTKAFKGYNADEVNEFLDRVLEDYTQLYSDNAELERKIEILANKLQEYRNAEATLSDAKDKIYRLAQEKAQAAKDEAAKIEREAREKAERIVIDARRDSERERRNYERLQLEVTRFRTKAINIFKSEIDQLNSLPTLQATPQEALRIQTETMIDEEKTADTGISSPFVSDLTASPVPSQRPASDAVAQFADVAASVGDTGTVLPVIDNFADNYLSDDAYLGETEKKPQEETAYSERSFTLNLKPKHDEPEDVHTENYKPFATAQNAAESSAAPADEETLPRVSVPVGNTAVTHPSLERPAEENPAEENPAVQKPAEQNVRRPESTSVDAEQFLAREKEKLHNTVGFKPVQVETNVNTDGFIPIANTTEITELLRQNAIDSRREAEEIARAESAANKPAQTEKSEQTEKTVQSEKPADKETLPPPEEEDVVPKQGKTGKFDIIDTENADKTAEKADSAEHPKFGQLRFGEDYDIENDDFSGKGFGGLFRRKNKKD